MFKEPRETTCSRMNARRTLVNRLKKEVNKEYKSGNTEKGAIIQIKSWMERFACGGDQGEDRIAGLGYKAEALEYSNNDNRRGKGREAEGWLRGQQLQLLFHRIQFQFSVPT